MFDVDLYENACSHAGRLEELQDELADLKKKWYAVLDEDEANAMYGEDIEDFEQEIESLKGTLYTMGYADLCCENY